jgi:hypothetical protein
MLDLKASAYKSCKLEKKHSSLSLRISRRGLTYNFAMQPHTRRFPEIEEHNFGKYKGTEERNKAGNKTGEIEKHAFNSSCSIFTTPMEKGFTYL